MFTVDEQAADAIRRAYEDGGELAGAVEFRRHYPLIVDNEHARRCVRIIVSWQPIPDRSRPPRRTTVRRAGPLV